MKNTFDDEMINKRYIQIYFCNFGRDYSNKLTMKVFRTGQMVNPTKTCGLNA